MKISSCTRTLLGPVRPTGQTGRSPAGQATAPYRSDRSDRPADWSMPILAVNICPPLFFGKTCLPKNILLNQNYLMTMINITSAIFCAKGDKQLSAISCLSWCWSDLFQPPYLLHDCWCLWLDLYLLLHCLLLAHTLQLSLLGMRQAWRTPLRL